MFGGGLALALELGLGLGMFEGGETMFGGLGSGLGLGLRKGLVWVGTINSGEAASAWVGARGRF